MALLVTRAILGAIAMVFLLKAYLVFNLNINWDEFFYLSHIYAYERGELSTPLQSLHVHIFYWLTFLPFNEIGQVISGRLVMLGLSVASAFLLYHIARRYFCQLVSLACVLLYVTFSNTLSHGTSFRTDPLCAFLFLWSVALYLDCGSRRWPLVMAGCLMAISFMVSIKTVLYAFFWIALFGWRLRKEPVRTARQILWLALSFLVFVGCLYGLHLTLLETSAETNGFSGWRQGSAVDAMRGSGRKALLGADLFPRTASFLISLSQNMITWVLVAVGGSLAIFRICRNRAGEPEYLALGGFLMLSTLLFYRNAFPYFYVFLIPPALLTAGLTWDWFVRDMEGEGIRARLARVAFWSCLLLVLANLSIYATRHADDRQVAQRETISLVHRLFPEPVPYIDRNSMISSFPKVGFFMSSWGIENYRERGVPIMRDILAEDQPKFLIANRRLLWLDHEQSDAEGVLQDYLLLDEDFHVLQDNFIIHWGALYLAGKRLEADENGKADFEILIEGPYTLESDSAVYLNGKKLEPGSVVDLAAGPYRLTMQPGSSEVRLRYGDHLPIPNDAPSRMPIYFGL